MHSTGPGGGTATAARYNGKPHMASLAKSPEVRKSLNSPNIRLSVMSP